MCLGEVYAGYLRGRRLGGRAHRGAHAKDHPRERQDPDVEAQDDLGKITSHIEKEWAIFADQIGRVEQEMRVEVGVMWEAFSSFAHEEMGLEPKTLIKAWFGPILPEIEAVEDTLDTTETNLQQLQEYASDLRQVWRKLVA